MICGDGGRNSERISDRMMSLSAPSSSDKPRCWVVWDVQEDVTRQTSQATAQVGLRHGRPLSKDLSSITKTPNRESTHQPKRVSVRFLHSSIHRPDNPFEHFSKRAPNVSDKPRCWVVWDVQEDVTRQTAQVGLRHGHPPERTSHQSPIPPIASRPISRNALAFGYFIH